ncbi:MULTISPECIES: hypothetical protein [Pseudoalteromonas]|uniref:Orphan protein n=1 Tax=Pseudoalteromonas aurantia 208 TaxID=1314867 RepID=A0ABR9EIG5_9GAMM|nr:MULTISPECIES: hypothetical protein [Pseudoalteromonas]MBE0370719.1 hypothetical protein [Pseudoalteromonas aurantia 208]MBQ4845464.1 hypothetical protein [Pseudoalteromonas sp. MMG005]
MKWIVFFILSVITAHQALASNARFTPSTCEKLAYKRAILITQIDKSSPQSKQFSVQEQRIFVLLQRHCSHSNANSELRLALPDDELLASPIDGMTYAGKMFSNDKKQRQWQKFYSIPSRCKVKNSSLDDFVWCSNNKGKQKRLFELYLLNDEDLAVSTNGYSLVAAKISNQ